jgi:hypothetical protein
VTVTVDSTLHTADASFPTADGYIPANIVFADVSDPVGGHITADTTAYTADASYPTADGGILPGAADLVDAVRIPAITYGGGYYWRPLPVVGVGYGVLPQLVGEAHGVVGVAGDGVGALSLGGEGRGEVDDGLDELIVLLMLAA